MKERVKVLSPWRLKCKWREREREREREYCGKKRSKMVTRQNKKKGTTMICIFLHSSAAFFSDATVQVYVVYTLKTVTIEFSLLLATPLSGRI